VPFSKDPPGALDGVGDMANLLLEVEQQRVHEDLSTLTHLSRDED
jgi:hypothetical protein